MISKQKVYMHPSPDIYSFSIQKEFTLNPKNLKYPGSLKVSYIKNNFLHPIRSEIILGSKEVFSNKTLK